MGVKLLLAIPAAVAALCVPASSDAENGVGFTDTRGEGGADISGMLVSNGDDGILQFKVLIPNLPNLPRDAAISIGFDVDRNPATGGTEGAEYLFRVREGSYNLVRWTGQAYVEADWRDVIATYRGGLDLWMDWENLGRPQSFDFFVRIERGAVADRAPDSGAYTFQVIVVEKAAALDATFKPAVPRAGRTFATSRLRIQLSTGRWVPVTRAECEAKLNGHRIRGRGPGRCSWRVPQNAAGKRLAVWIYAFYKGERVRFVPFVYRVRA